MTHDDAKTAVLKVRRSDLSESLPVLKFHRDKLAMYRLFISGVLRIHKRKVLQTWGVRTARRLWWPGPTSPPRRESPVRPVSLAPGRLARQMLRGARYQRAPVWAAQQPTGPDRKCCGCPQGRTASLADASMKVPAVREYSTLQCRAEQPSSSGSHRRRQYVRGVCARLIVPCSTGVFQRDDQRQRQRALDGFGLSLFSLWKFGRHSGL